MPPAGPRAEYEQRLARFRVQQTILQRRLAWLGNARFALFVAGMLLFFMTILLRLASPYWLLLPTGVFVCLSLAFDRASSRCRHASRAVAYYEFGLARLDERWAGRGVSGARYLDETHLFAADLDLFGTGSLFERLCDARTRIGRDMLAQWLRAPAGLDEVLARQAAVDELRARLDWREQLALLGADVPDGIDTATLATWGAVVAAEPSVGPKWIARFLVALTWLSVAAWVIGWFNSMPLVAALLLQGSFALAMRPRVRRALDGLRVRSRDLLHLTNILTCMEREPFQSARLVQLQTALCSGQVRPSQRLAQLVELIAKLDSRNNLFFAPLAPLLLWTTQVAFGLEWWRWRTGPVLPRWVTVMGEMEALNALAGYAYENPEDPFPEIVSGIMRFEARDLGHPLLPRAVCVTNDLCLSEQCRLLVVSGSNMSGKSTFLRTVGINTVLALAGAPVRASNLRLSPLAIGATLRIQDSLQAGRSRFYAEITRLREIVDLARGSLPVLFLLDEVLQGTNSHDRRIGAEAIMRTLLNRPALGLVTTHDLALTESAQKLGPHAANCHFADQLVDGTLRFDYRLHPGVVQHSNALALMRAVGLEVDAPQGPSQTGT
jgi:hypothetical protein